MNVGFIGVGTITEAVVTGLCEAEVPGLSILLSPRSVDRSRRLSERYTAVEVAADNQQVLDRSELVFLAVRPQDAGDVLGALDFRRDLKVVSFIATVSSAGCSGRSGPPSSSAGWRRFHLWRGAPAPLRCVRRTGNWPVSLTP